MKTLRCFSALLTIIVVFLSAFGVNPAVAQHVAQPTMAGVKFEPEITVGGTKLQLNGTGVRTRAIFRVYSTALYTPARVTRNDEVLKPIAKRLQLVALRDVKGDDLGRLMARTMEDNSTKEEFSKSIANVVRLGQVFADAKTLVKGDVITIDYIPNVGVILSHKGKQVGEPFKEQEFHTLLFKNWFGPKPADEALRKALLGEASTANTNIY